MLPIGVKVDGAAATTADIDADSAAFRGDSSPIQPGQTGGPGDTLIIACVSLDCWLSVILLSVSMSR